MLSDLDASEIVIMGVVDLTDFELLVADKGLSEFVRTYLDDAAWGMPTPKNSVQVQMAKMMGQPPPTTRPREHVAGTFEQLLRVRDERARRAQAQIDEEDRKAEEMNKAGTVKQLRRMAAEARRPTSRDTADGSVHETHPDGAALAQFLDDQANQIEAGTLNWKDAKSRPPIAEGQLTH